ncbi:uncharacterized protein LOC104440423 [Eucalyptus grandis]|uniref:uncharacterized protein LOC104440423 n=1 Tax=Eucalyptus grandis TaxID=71139 RepID=UPI00192EA695|nr:uncharacterized protein LOC104440423 [Eucalyptus grandis]
MKVLSEICVLETVEADKLEEFVGSIILEDLIAFYDEEFPLEGRGHNKALYISVKHKSFHVSRVLIDNGFALNICPLATLHRLKRYMLRRRRPWIHIAGAVPSSFHQDVKFVIKRKPITVYGKEDHWIYQETAIPYVEPDFEFESSYHSFELVSTIHASRDSSPPTPEVSNAALMVGSVMVGNGFIPGSGLGRNGQGIRNPIEAPQRSRSAGLGYCGRDEAEVIDTMGQPSGKFDYLVKYSASPRFYIDPRDIVLDGGDGMDDLTSPKAENPDDASEGITRIVLRHTKCSWEVHEKAKALTSEQTVTINLSDTEEAKEVKIGANLPKDKAERLIQLLNEYQDIFAWTYADMPRLDPSIMEHCLPTNTDVPPKKQRLRRTKAELSKKIEEEVMKLLKVGFIEVSQYPEWVANIVPVMKKDGRVRVCVDYRDLNKASSKDDFSLPHIDVLVDSTAGFELFSFMDGATYRWAMVALFHDMMHQEIEVYVDDMIAKTRLGRSRVETLKKLFDRLREFKLRLNPAKCVFGATSGKLLGFIVSNKGIEIDPSKAKVISFDKLKQYLMNPLILVPQLPGHPLILYLTIHSESLGAMLAQESSVDRRERAIYYLSKKFIVSELKYSDTEKTWAALVWVLYRLRQYTLHYQMFLVTENNPIKYLLDRPALVGFSNNDYSFLDDRVLNVSEDSWTMFFDGAVNLSGSACILGLQAAIEIGVAKLKVFEDSTLIILQTVGEWKTKDAKLLMYHEYLEDLVKEFDKILFEYLPRSHNQFVDALATLSSMLQVTDGLEVKPLKIEVLPKLAYCMIVIEEPDGKPWYYDIMNYIQKQEFPEGSPPTDRKYITKMVSKFLVSGENLYKRSYDSVLLQCVDAAEATQIMQEASNGHRFILVAIDYFSKWIEATSFTSVAARNVAKFVKCDIIAHYGIPEEIITDNGTNLNNKLVDGLFSEFKIKHLNSLPFALMAYRTSIRTFIGATHFALVYGMEAVLPVEVEIPSLRVLSQVELSEAEWRHIPKEHKCYQGHPRLRQACLHHPPCRHHLCQSPPRLRCCRSATVALPASRQSSEIPLTREPAMLLLLTFLEAVKSPTTTASYLRLCCSRFAAPEAPPSLASASAVTNLWSVEEGGVETEDEEPEEELEEEDPEEEPELELGEDPKNDPEYDLDED